MKTLTVVIPAYNATAQLANSLDSLIDSGRLADLDVIVVNDGSVDQTEALAQSYVDKYPEHIRLFNKERGGSGSVINLGIREAQGGWIKILDSDDRIIPEGFVKVLDEIEKNDDLKNRPEMIVTDYLYEVLRAEEEPRYERANFLNVFLEPGISSWSRLKNFDIDQILSKHSIFYNMDLLKKVGLRLPEHLTYVEQIFAYEPLPHVRRILYIAEPSYIYSLGREAQASNILVMQNRLDELIMISLEMFRRVRLDSVRPQRLQTYMYRHMSRVLGSCLMLASAEEEGNADALRRTETIWQEFMKINPVATRKLQKMPSMNSRRLIKAAHSYINRRTYNLIGKVFII